MFDVILGAFASGSIYKILANFPGVVLLLFSLFALIVFTWKHKSTASPWKFSLKYLTDWATIGMISVGFLTGIFLVVAKAFSPEEVKCLLF